MLRFIVRDRSRWGGYETEGYRTIDVECHELEAALTRGGHTLATGDYEVTSLVGVEVLTNPSSPSDA